MKTKHYSADVGKWDAGRVVRFDAKSDKQAIEKAHKIKRKSTEDIVQIRELKNKDDDIGRVFYDFINGHMES